MQVENLEIRFKRFLYRKIELLPYILPTALRCILVTSGLSKAIGRLPGLHDFGSVSLYEPDVCMTIKQIVKPGWICADVGAHMGLITLLLARLVGADGRVIAFEPFPENVRLLREKCLFWGYAERVCIENTAVSNGADNRLWLFTGRGRSSTEWNIMGHDVDGNVTKPELEVCATSLDAYFPVGSNLDFVKIDVEGAEAKVLTGMRRLLSEARPVVVVEFHDEVGWAGRGELLAGHYHLYDMSGRRLAPDSQRIYHVLAVPQERDV